MEEWPRLGQDAARNRTFNVHYSTLDHYQRLRLFTREGGKSYVHHHMGGSTVRAMGYPLNILLPHYYYIMLYGKSQ